MSAARKLDVDAPIAFKLGPAALLLVAPGRAEDAALEQAAVGATKKSGTTEAAATATAELREVTRQLEPILREMQVHADPDRLGYEWTGTTEEIATEAGRLAAKGRAMLRAWHGLKEDVTPPRMWFIEAIRFHATCECRDPIDDSDTAEGNAARRRARRAASLIEGFARIYPDQGAQLDVELVADAIKAWAAAPRKRIPIKAIRAAWPERRPDARAWAKEWSRWKDNRWKDKSRWKAKSKAHPRKPTSSP